MTFGEFLRAPSTGPLLDSMLADNAAVDAAIRADAGPRQCCADAGVVIDCDGEMDTWECLICGRAWSAPCR